MPELPHKPTQAQELQPLQLWGGIECTINRVHGHYFSQLARSGHLERSSDLERIAELGIRTLRFPLLWEQLAPNHPGQIDWSWADARMQQLQELGITPIVGLLHHGSGPRYTSLVDLRFPELFARYARAVAERYPWIQAWTPVNEPLTTARFSGLYGHWFPHGRKPSVFARALLGEIRATSLAMREVRQVNPDAQFIQTEDLGKTFSSPALQYQADYENERRWLGFDLLTGKLARNSSIWRYMLRAGITPRELEGFREEPCPPDILGINHYVTSSRFLDENLELYPATLHGGNGRHRYVDVEAARYRSEGTPPPEELLREAWERYQTPIAVTEAHLGCTREEQLRWFAELWTAARKVRTEGVPLLAVTAWSLFGAYDWNSLLTESTDHYEPGAFDVRSTPPRLTAIAGLLRHVATTGEPAHPLLQMPGWWRRDVRFLPGDPACQGRQPRGEVQRQFPAEKSTAKLPAPLLITGATGTLGQAFARLCELRGLPYKLLSRAEMDVADAGSVRHVLSTLKPWAVINTAGYVRVDDAELEHERCFRENALGPENLARACGEAAVQLVTFSSDLVFNGRKTAPYIESDAVAPLNVYGASKAAAENAVSAALPTALIIRTSAFFGPWDQWNFVTQTLQKLLAGEPVTAADDLLITPTYVPELVHTALDLLIDGGSGIWHLANQEPVSWADLAREVARLGNCDESLIRGCPAEELHFKAERPAYTALSSERGKLLSPWYHALRVYFREPAVMHRIAKAPPARPAEFASLASS